LSDDIRLVNFARIFHRTATAPADVSHDLNPPICWPFKKVDYPE